MNYSAIIVVQGKVERLSLEERVINLEPLFDNVVVVCKDVTSLYFIKQTVIAPYFDSTDFLNFVYTGLSCASHEWSFVCTDKYDVAANEIKHMKGFLSKSQVVLWNENPQLGFYRRHSLPKMEKILREKQGIQEFLKMVRVRNLSRLFENKPS